MGNAALTSWGYYRRKYERTKTVSSGGTSYTAWAYSITQKEESPDTFYIGGNQFTSSQSGGGTSYTKYKEKINNDFPYIKFDLPPDNGATRTIKLKLKSSFENTIKIARITSSLGSIVPSFDEDTAIDYIVPKKTTATWTAEIDITDLIEDMRDSNNYGLILVSTQGTTSNSTLCTVASGIVLSWDDVSATVPTYDSTDVNVGGTVHITTNNTNPSVKHNLSWTFNGNSGTIATNIGNTTTSWNITDSGAVDYAALIPNAKYGNFKVTCESFLDGNSIGTSTKTVKIRVPNTYRCKVTGATLTDTSVIPSMGIAEFVQGKSTLRVEVATSDSTAHGATVTGYSISINGGTLKGNEVVTSPLKTAGSNSYSITITDSRGWTDTMSLLSFDVIPYNAPSISIISAKRDANNPDDVVIDYSWAFSQLLIDGVAENTCLVEMFLNGGTAVNSEYKTAETGSDTYTYENVEEGFTELTVSLTDIFTTVSYTMTLGNAGQISIDVAQDGSVGIGMEAQEDGNFDVGLPSRFNGTIAVRNNASSPLINFQRNGDSSRAGFIGTYAANANTYDSRIRLVERSGNAADTDWTNYYEYYYLPHPQVGLTSNKIYNLWTTKETAVQLWSGAWSSGDITVPNTDKYHLFGIVVDNFVGIIPAPRTESGVIRGLSGYGSASTFYEVLFMATYSGNVWTYVRTRRSDTTTAMQINEIWGFI